MPQKFEIEQSVLDSLPILVSYVDRERIYRYVNNQFRNWFGKSDHQIIGNPIKDVIGADAYNDIIPYIERVLSGETCSAEHLIYDGKGTSRFLEVDYVPDVKKDNEISGYYALAKDITHRKYQEKNKELLDDLVDKSITLKNTEEVFKLFSTTVSEYFAISNCLFADINLDKEEVSVPFTLNSKKNLPELKGNYDLADFVDKKIIKDYKQGKSIVIDDTQQDPRVNSENYAALNIHSCIIVPYLREGKWTYLFAINDNKPRVWREEEIQLIKDLTYRLCAKIEHTRAEEQVKKNEQRLQLAIKSSNLGIHEYNIQNNYIEWDSRVRELWGVDQDVAITYDIFINGIHPDDRLLTQEAVDKSLDPKGDGVYKVEYRVINDKTGEIRWLSVIGKTFFQDDKPITMLGTVRDITEQFIQKDELEERQAKFALLVENLPDVVFHLDKELRHLYASPRIEKFTGIPAAEWIGKTGKEMGLPEETFAPFAELVNESFKSGEERSLEFEDRSKIFRTRIIPEKSDDNIVKSVLGITEDITEQKQAQREIEESEERFRNLFNTIDEGFAIVEVLYDKNDKPIDHRMLQVNPTYEKHSGLINAVGKTASELTPGIEQFWNDWYDEIIKTGKSERKELYSEAFGRWFDVNVSRIGDKSERKVAVVFSDITSRMKSEQALRESEEKFRLMADMIPEMIWITDTEGSVEFLNKPYYTYSGTAPGSKTASDIAAEVVHPEDAPKVMAAFGEAMENEAPFEIEQRNRSKSGEYRWFINRGMPYRDPKTGKISKWFGSSTDIHEMKLAEEALREADYRKDNFLAVLAHELRNPLTPVKGAIDILNENEDEQLNEKARKIITRQVSKLVHLIDDLMDISRITRDKIRLQKQNIDLAEAIEVALETTEPLISASNHEFTFTPPSQPIMIYADADRIIQILTNLLTNAIKYTKPGGDISLSLIKESDNVLITVKDNGLGISEDQKDKIFEMFEQSEARKGYENSGLGIGLSLVKKLVEMHNGQITVKSEGQGYGSEFTVSLPITDQKIALESNKEPESPKPIEGSRILLVDDNEDIVDLMASSLEKRGFLIKKAYSGSEAFEGIEEFMPQVALLDIGLPDIDGYHVARKLRKQFPDIKLIAHSGWGQQSDKRKSKEAGFDFHLVKPAGIKDVLKILTSE